MNISEVFRSNNVLKINATRERTKETRVRIVKRAVLQVYEEAIIDTALVELLKRLGHPTYYNTVENDRLGGLWCSDGRPSSTELSNLRTRQEQKKSN